MTMTLEDRVIPCVFSLHQDIPGLVNAQRTFVELGDPTGYKWAIKYLGDWNHWLKLVECSWFKVALTVWQKELSAKSESEMLSVIHSIASDEANKARFQAAKYLADQHRKPASRRGRPSTEEVTGELKKEAQERLSEDNDAARIGLKVITGGKS